MKNLQGFSTGFFYGLARKEFSLDTWETGHLPALTGGRGRRAGQAAARRALADDAADAGIPVLCVLLTLERGRAGNAGCALGGCRDDE